MKVGVIGADRRAKIKGTRKRREMRAGWSFEARRRALYLSIALLSGKCHLGVLQMRLWLLAFWIHLLHFILLLSLLTYSPHCSSSRSSSAESSPTFDIIWNWCSLTNTHNQYSCWRSCRGKNHTLKLGISSLPGETPYFWLHEHCLILLVVNIDCCWHDCAFVLLSLLVAVHSVVHICWFTWTLLCGLLSAADHVMTPLQWADQLLVTFSSLCAFYFLPWGFCKKSNICVLLKMNSTSIAIFSEGHEAHEK